ncbi:kinase-like domain-containing protein [Phycomyces blakesleeanus]|uniref:Kinase-like domain-containing protein n=1 Tax=Phycomyces blakesleeanus TaxID=4837 RepID=A0ABR3AQ16_PHYBL
MPTYTVSLIRYQFDFIEFHKKIRLHYPKSKIPFPALSNPSTTLCFVKRRSIRNLLSFNKKSNADKIENYLNCCFQHSIVSISSILRDFISVQREEDSMVSTDAYAPSIRSDSIQSPLSPTRVSLDDFDLLKVLGKGCMGKVLLVRSYRNSRLYALKAIQKERVVQQKEVTHTLAERDILVRLRGQPFLATLHHAFQTPSQLYLVLDYYGGGDIATQMSLCTIFSKERARLYVAEILHGLSILHGHGIVYRDLKPENILIALDGHIVLADFGLSKIFSSDDPVDEESGVPSTQTFCGTAEYIAPEVLVGEPYSYAADFWSLGTLLYEMLAGITPFWAETHAEMYDRVIKDSLEFPSHFDSVTRDFISGLLTRDVHKRLGWGIDGADRIKEHSYFDPLDWEDVIQQKLQPDYVPALKSETDLANFDDMFVSMSPRISIVSEASFGGSEENPAGDPFESFGYDPLFDSIPHSPSGLSNYTDTDQDLPERNDSWISQQPSRTLLRSLRLNNQNQRLGRERLSSSSSFLSFSAGDIIRHTDTIPSLLSNSEIIPRKQKLLKHTSSNSYMRKRHSAALSVAPPNPIDTHYTSGPSYDQSSNYEDQERVRTIKKRQTTSSTIESFGPNSSNPSYNINPATYTRSPESSIRDLASIYSKSSMNLVSSRPSNPINNLVRDSSEYSLGKGTRFLDRLSTRIHSASPYTRPHCPVPGQIRPDISVAGPSTVLESSTFVSTTRSSFSSDIS